MALAPNRTLRRVAQAALVAATACGDPDRLVVLEDRVAALEAAAASDGAPAAAVTHPGSGVLIEDLPPDRVLGCVVQVTDQAMAALYAHEALWEAFTDDITALDWAPASPCRWYTAARVVPFTPDGTRVEVEVVVTRGAHAGRRWRSDLAVEPREVARWTAAERAAALNQGRWAGDRPTGSERADEVGE